MKYARDFGLYQTRDLLILENISFDTLYFKQRRSEWICLLNTYSGIISNAFKENLDLCGLTCFSYAEKAYIMTISCDDANHTGVISGNFYVKEKNMNSYKKDSIFIFRDIVSDWTCAKIIRSYSRHSVIFTLTGFRHLHEIGLNNFGRRPSVNLQVNIKDMCLGCANFEERLFVLEQRNQVLGYALLNHQIIL